MLFYFLEDRRFSFFWSFPRSVSTLESLLLMASFFLYLAVTLPPPSGSCEWRIQILRVAYSVFVFGQLNARPPFFFVSVPTNLFFFRLLSFPAYLRVLDVVLAGPITLSLFKGQSLLRKRSFPRFVLPRGTTVINIKFSGSNSKLSSPSNSKPVDGGHFTPLLWTIKLGF